MSEGLTANEKDTIVGVVAEYDPGAKKAYECGDLTYRPKIQDSLEMADLELRIEERLKWEAIDFDPWANVKANSTLSEIFAGAAAVKKQLFG